MSVLRSVSSSTTTPEPPEARPRRSGPTRVDPHNWRTALFIQDDVKLTSELTANFGVRYDYLTDPENNLAYPAVNPLTALVDPITAYYRVNNDKNNISPRAGFAFVPHEGFFRDGKTVLHAGFGVYFDSEFSNIVVNGAQSSPNAVVQLATFHGYRWSGRLECDHPDAFTGAEPDVFGDLDGQ